MHKFFLSLLAILIIFICPQIAKADCIDNGSGQVVCTFPNGYTETFSVDSGTDVGALFEGCEPLGSKLSQFAQCMMCDMYLTIFNTANLLVKNAFSNLAAPLRNIMSIVLAILIAFNTLAQLSSFSQVSGATYIDDLFKQLFKFFVSFAFLTLYDQVFYWILNPILTAGIEIGAGFLSHAQSIETIQALNSPQMSDFFSSDVYTKIEQFSIAVQQELAFMQAIGSSLMCIACNEGRAEIVGFKIFPDGSMLISGLTMYTMAVAISVAFGYYLIDGVLQLCLAGILTPFSLAAYPFGFSQKWMETTWKCFLDTFFKFVFMGLVISIITEIMAFAVTGGEGGYDLLIEAMNGDDAEVLAEFFSITDVSFLTFIVCSIFASKLTGKATDLAGSMSGESMISAGGKLGGLAMSGISKIAKKTTAPARKAAGKAIKGGLNKAGGAAKKGLSKAGGAIKKGASKFANDVNKKRKGG